MPALTFDFHGLQVEVLAPPPVAEEVRRDFSYFLIPPQAPARPATISIQLHHQAPPYASLPDLAAAFVTPRNVVYPAGDLSYIDYFGRGLVIRDRLRGTFQVFASDLHMLREMVYLLLLSRVGEHLDGMGLHRLHALGLSYRGRAVLLLLPSGGGKSTMALHLLGRDDFRILSEDSPLIDRRGQVWPFPGCLGLKQEPASQTIPEKFLRRVNRMEFDPKTLVDLEFFRHRLETNTIPPWLILVGRRQLGPSTFLKPLGRVQAWRALLANMVVGIGLYQGLEFLLERQAWELLSRGGLVASRAWNALRLLSRVECWSFHLGRDLQKNSEVLERFLSDKSPS